tara:strand:- start:621 stop:890 length:270 start_codon:yes stop_codon:yes gene_type:complete
MYITWTYIANYADLPWYCPEGAFPKDYIKGRVSLSEPFSKDVQHYIDNVQFTVFHVVAGKITYTTIKGTEVWPPDTRPTPTMRSVWGPS